MPAADVVRSMKARVPWPVAGQIWSSLGLGKSLGWRRTLARVEDGQLGFDDVEDALRDALEEHLICGEKLTRFFRLTDDAMDELREAVDGLRVTPTAFSRAFPLLLSEDRLRAFQGHRPTIIAKVEYHIGTAVVLASTRYMTTREAILPAELPDAAAAELRDFEEIICVRHQRLQGIDVLWVPATSDVIELRTDFPLGSHFRHAVVASELAETEFSRAFSPDIFLDQINLFPAIQNLYTARGNGRMVELGFMVSGSAQKLERTRRDLECCREEAYHLGGVGALRNPIAAYRTSVLWQHPLTDEVITEPEISLRGTSVQTAESEPFLGEAVIRNCTGLDDYEFVRDRLLEHTSGVDD